MHLGCDGSAIDSELLPRPFNDVVEVGEGVDNARQVDVEATASDELSDVELRTLQVDPLFVCHGWLQSGLEQLEELLVSDEVPADCMNMEMLDGHLAAIVASPLPIPRAVTLENFAAVVSSTDAEGGWLFGRQVANSRDQSSDKPMDLSCLRMVAMLS